MNGFAKRQQSAEELLGVVRTAIRERRPIGAWYGGVRRLFCPHVLGCNQAGEYLVFSYQHGGESRSEPAPVPSAGIWRCFALRKLSGVELLEGEWYTEPHAPQRCVEQVEIEAGV
jgi:hypothetical protein